MKKPHLSLLAILALGVASANAQIVYEGFNYSVGTNTASAVNAGSTATTTGQAENATGLTGSYVMNRGGGTQNVNGSSFASGSLSYGTLSTTGGKLQWDGVHASTAASNFMTVALDSTAASALAPTTSSQTIWMSYLINSNTFANGQGVYLKNSAATGDTTGANVFGFGINSASQAFVAYNNTTTNSGTLSLSTGTTYWLVGNFSYDKTGSTTTFTAANLWLLSGGSIPGSEGALGAATATFSGSSTSTSDRTPFSLAFQTGSSPADPQFDEVRIGTSYLNVVPEPTTWALLAGSLTALVIFRRRRQS